MVWPATRGLVRRTIELLLAVIISKLVICIALSVGVAALAGAGAAGSSSAAASTAAGSSMGTLFVGAAVLVMAAFAPFMVLKLIPWAESAVVAQGMSHSPVRAANSTMGTAYYANSLTRLGGGGSAGADPTGGAAGEAAAGAGAADSAVAADAGSLGVGASGAEGMAAGAAAGTATAGVALAVQGVKTGVETAKSTAEQTVQAAADVHGPSTGGGGFAGEAPSRSAGAEPAGPVDPTASAATGNSTDDGGGGGEAEDLPVRPTRPDRMAARTPGHAVRRARAGHLRGRHPPRPRDVPDRRRPAPGRRRALCVRELQRSIGVRAGTGRRVSWWFRQVRGTNRWFARTPMFGPGGERADEQPDLPPSLAGITIHGVEADGRRVGGQLDRAALIRDRRDRTVSAVVRVQGRQFALCERAEQERLLHLWGDALSSFCAERGPVGRIRWTEWTAPAGLEAQLAYLDEHAGGESDRAAVRSVPRPAGTGRPDGHPPRGPAHRHGRRATGSSRPRCQSPSRGRGGPARGDAPPVASSRVGRAPGRRPPLTPGGRRGISAAVSTRSGCCAGRRSGRTLAELAGLVSVANAGPLAVDADWDHVRVDGAWHVGYVVSEWPRLEVPPNWMEPMLLHAGGIRTVAVHYEPVAPSRSQRQIDRESVKLLSDEEQRNRSGFRIGARHRRAEREVLDREAELVAGYGEFEFAGFVVVSAADRDQLDRSCAEYEQVAAQAGLELRRLDGRHDLALACMLPIGRGLAPRRFS